MCRDVARCVETFPGNISVGQLLSKMIWQLMYWPVPTSPSISMPVNNFLMIWVWVSDWSRTVILCVLYYYSIIDQYITGHSEGTDQVIIIKTTWYCPYHGKLKPNRTRTARLILGLIITQWTPRSVSQVSMRTKTGTHKLLSIVPWQSTGLCSRRLSIILVKMFSKLNFTTDQLESWSEILQLQNYKIAETNIHRVLTGLYC